MLILLQIHTIIFTSLSYTNKIIIKNFLYIIMTSVDVIKYSEYPPSSTNDTIKQDQLFEEFTILIETIKNIRDKKIKDFLKIYKVAVDHTYEIDDPI